MKMLFEEVKLAEDDKKYKEVVEVIAAEFPARFGTAIMKYLSSISSLNEIGLGHLKRIKKGQKSSSLIAIVSIDAIEQKMMEVLKEKFEALTFTVPVPKWPARNKEEYQESCCLWPMVFHNTSSSEFEEIKDEEKVKMIECMGWALKDVGVDTMTINADSGCLNCGVIVVDPQTGKVVAKSSDIQTNDEKQPLFHAVFRAIEAVAQVDRSSKKVKKEATVHDPRSSSSYLCTGYDIYSIREPCVMCSMALVHSRARRVIYGCGNDVAGALGTHYLLHVLPSLNHHYRVFRGVLHEECSRMFSG